MKLKPPVTKLYAKNEVTQRRKDISPKEILEKTERIKERLSNCDDFVFAKKIFTYISNIPGDIDTRKIIELALGFGKEIFLPKLHEPTKSIRRFPFITYNKLVENREKLLEPEIGIEEDLSDIDLIIVPGIAVSLAGQRVGLGEGYFDKLLRKAYAPKYVLAFEFQLFKEIESERHDVRIDRIITERRIIDTREL